METSFGDSTALDFVVEKRTRAPARGESYRVSHVGYAGRGFSTLSSLLFLAATAGRNRTREASQCQPSSAAAVCKGFLFLFLPFLWD